MGGWGWVGGLRGRGGVGCIGLGVMRARGSRCREKLSGGAPECSAGAGGSRRIKLVVRRRSTKDKKRPGEKEDVLFTVFIGSQTGDRPGRIATSLADGGHHNCSHNAERKCTKCKLLGHRRSSGNVFSCQKQFGG